MLVTRIEPVTFAQLIHPGIGGGEVVEEVEGG